MRAVFTALALSLLATPALAGPSLGLIPLDEETMSLAEALKDAEPGDFDFLKDPEIQRAIDELDQSLEQQRRSQAELVRAQQERDAALAEMNAFLAENGDELASLLRPAARPAPSTRRLEALRTLGDAPASTDVRVVDPTGDSLYRSLLLD